MCGFVYFFRPPNFTNTETIFKIKIGKTIDTAENRVAIQHGIYVYSRYTYFHKTLEHLTHLFFNFSNVRDTGEGNEMFLFTEIPIVNFTKACKLVELFDEMLNEINCDLCKLYEYDSTTEYCCVDNDNDSCDTEMNHKNEFVIVKNKNGSRFYCEVCNYGTNKPSDMKKHEETKVHMKKIEQTKNNEQLKTNKQLKNNTEKKIININSVNKKHNDNNLQSFSERLSKLEKIVFQLSNSHIVKRVNVYKHITTHYNKISELKQLSSQLSLKLLNCEKMNEQKIAENMLDKQKQHDLENFIGNFIIKEYKKENPELQQFWTIAQFKFVFLVRQRVNFKVVWMRDTNGLHIIKHIINPLVETIGNILKTYIERQKELAKTKILDVEKLKTYIQLESKISQDITNNKLQRKIMVYICNHFCLDKNNVYLDTIKTSENINNNVDYVDESDVDSTYESDAESINCHNNIKDKSNIKIKKHICECLKEYTNRQGLYKHRKTCTEQYYVKKIKNLKLELIKLQKENTNLQKNTNIHK